jgi:hypothetical protein
MIGRGGRPGAGDRPGLWPAGRRPAGRCGGRSACEAIAGSVQRTFGRRSRSRWRQGWRPLVLPEAESIPIALTVNELLTNAIKHGSRRGIGCTAGCDARDEDAACPDQMTSPIRAGCRRFRPRRRCRRRVRPGPGARAAAAPHRHADAAQHGRRAGARRLPGVVLRAAQRAGCVSRAGARPGALRRQSGNQAGASGVAPMAGKGKILVVDDDRLVLATVTHGLAQAGYEVIDADNGDDAILLAREHRPEPGAAGHPHGRQERLRRRRLPARRTAASRSCSCRPSPTRRRCPGAGRWARWPTWSSRWTSARSCPRSTRPSRLRTQSVQQATALAAAAPAGGEPLADSVAGRRHRDAPPVAVARRGLGAPAAPGRWARCR